MKIHVFTGLAIIIVVLLAACNRKLSSHFSAERISKTASIVANGNIGTVYPLFGAFEERKLDYSWKPILIYPDKEIIEEGTTFKTIQDKHKHGGSDEKEFLWYVMKYEPSQNLIQYFVSTHNRFWTVTVKCEAASEMQTKVTVTYTYTGLNEQGNKINEMALSKMFKNDLKDWEEGINYYLEHGKAINKPE